MSAVFPRLRHPGEAASTRPSIPAPVLAAAQEVTVVLTLYVLYRLGRLLMLGHEARAVANAAIMHDAEAWLHLPGEAVIQAAVGSRELFRLADTYYVSVHFPVMIAFLTLGYLTRSRPQYRWARDLVAVQTGLALIVQMIFPLAPPRMFPQWGFVDTMTEYGPSAYDGAAATVANQFAAMPSLHIGWAVLIAYVVARTGPRWVALAMIVHALVTVAVVIVTANHWWLDGVVSIVLLGIALVVFPRPGENRVRSLIAAHRRPLPSAPSGPDADRARDTGPDRGSASDRDAGRDREPDRSPVTVTAGSPS